MTANELDPLPIGGMAGQGGSISSAAPSNSPGGAADLDLDAIEARVASVAAWRPHLMSMRGSDLGQTLHDVPALIAEVRALRAEVAALNAETRARCEQIRAVLDRK